MSIYEIISKYHVESRCFGFIEFDERVDTQSLIEDVPHVIDGKVVDCKIAVPKNTSKDSEKKKKKKLKRSIVMLYDSPDQDTQLLDEIQIDALNLNQRHNSIDQM